MTGAFDRLRAWLGSIFGGSRAETEDGTSDPGVAPEKSAPEVVHRDDRPLETPGTMDRTDPPTPASRTERPDEPRVAGAEAAEDAGGKATDASPDTVSIPDAEATAGASTDDSSTPSGRAGSTVDEQSASTPETTTEDREDVTDGAFACSVCGTTVDDPSEPCPLCRSTDVVPASTGERDAETPKRGGRTTVSTADDEAVDRLRDVTDEG